LVFVPYDALCEHARKAGKLATPVEETRNRDFGKIVLS